MKLIVFLLVLSLKSLQAEMTAGEMFTKTSKNGDLKAIEMRRQGTDHSASPITPARGRSRHSIGSYLRQEAASHDQVDPW